MRAVVTGGAGCIGSELAGHLLSQENDVIVYDNLSSGKAEHIESLLDSKNFTFIQADLLDFNYVRKAVKGADIVFHLAANSDIKFEEGDSTEEDMKQNTTATYNVLEAMRKENVRKIVFTSSSAIYGEAKIVPTPESYGPLEPISLYGASKVACETEISAFCHMFDMQSWIFRFANIVGQKRRRTGTTVLTDFINKLIDNKIELQILGDGKQSKCYLTVEDCIKGIMTGLEKAPSRVNIFNLGPADAITVNEIAHIVAEEMGISDVRLKYTGGDRGWIGDVPRFMLDSSKIEKLGWRPSCSSRDAIRTTVKKMLEVYR